MILRFTRSVPHERTDTVLDVTYRILKGDSLARASSRLIERHVAHTLR
jgi:hypothetical protein